MFSEQAISNEGSSSGKKDNALITTKAQQALDEPKNAQATFTQLKEQARELHNGREAFVARTCDTAASAVLGHCIAPKLARLSQSVLTGNFSLPTDIDPHIYLSPTVTRLYPGKFHDFMLNGYYLLYQAAQETFAELANPEHPQHPLLKIFSEARMEKHKFDHVSKRNQRLGIAVANENVDEVRDAQTGWLKYGIPDNVQQLLRPFDVLQRAYEIANNGRTVSSEVLIRNALAATDRLVWPIHLSFTQLYDIFGPAPGFPQIGKEDEPIPENPFPKHHTLGKIENGAFVWNHPALENEPPVTGYCPVAVHIRLLDPSIEILFEVTEKYLGQPLPLDKNEPFSFAQVTNIPLAFIAGKTIYDKKI